jgi:hypothetical protein
MKNNIIYILLIFTIQLKAQEEKKPIHRIDVASFGVGIGLDYGGIGVNFTTYLHENVGIFGGVGYFPGSFMYNVGAKARLISKKKPSNINPFILGMYGVNTVAKFKSFTGGSYSRSFKGFTFGAGLDFSFKKRKAGRGHWSFALLVPIRDTNGFGVKNTQPVGISLGYKIILQTKTIKLKDK